MSPQLRQVLWFVALWVAGVLTLGTVAMLIRLVLMP
ncbi:MAG: DUF2474 family protein [Sneathiella sp.]